MQPSLPAFILLKSRRILCNFARDMARARHRRRGLPDIASDRRVWGCRRVKTSGRYSHTSMGDTVAPHWEILLNLNLPLRLGVLWHQKPPPGDDLFI
eukprot:2206808-Amphidinium_carterae.2